jgi:hypothetical protein
MWWCGLVLPTMTPRLQLSAANSSTVSTLSRPALAAGQRTSQIGRFVPRTAEYQNSPGSVSASRWLLAKQSKIGSGVMNGPKRAVRAESLLYSQTTDICRAL